MKKLLFVLLALLSVNTFAEPRNALLIANAKYQNFGSLATPVKEARDLKKTLETLGFSVTIVENASLEQMQEAVDSFGNKIAEARRNRLLSLWRTRCTGKWTKLSYSCKC